MAAIRKKRAIVTPAIFEQVIEALKNGITVKQLVRSQQDNPDFPLAPAIYDYAFSDNAIKSRYLHAREQCADSLADEVIDIADNEPNPQTARNRMNSRQWLAAKILPKVYGDKIDIDLNNKIDVSIAIQHARQRASHVIEHQPQLAITTSDIESDDKATVLENDPRPDPFS